MKIIIIITLIALVIFIVYKTIEMSGKPKTGANDKGQSGGSTKKPPLNNYE